MAVTQVQNKAGTGSFASSQVVTFSAAATAGNIISVAVAWDVRTGGTTGTTWTITDDASGGSNTYTADAASREVVTSTTHYVEIGVQHFYCVGCKAATNITVTPSQACDIAPAIYEITAGQHDTTSSTGTGTSAVAACTSATPSQNGAFSVSAVYSDDGLGVGNVGAAGSGYSGPDLDVGAGGSGEAGTEHIAQTTAAGLTGNFPSLPASGTWVVGQIIFIPSGGGSPTITGYIPHRTPLGC